MHSQRVLVSILILVIGTLIGCATGSRLDREQLSEPGELLFNGYVHDQIECYACHNGDATGTWLAPDLRDLKSHLSEVEIDTTIREGPSYMPAFDQKLTEEEIGQIISWLLTLSSR